MAKGKQQRDSVVFYRSFYEAVKELEPAQQAEVYNAVLEFGLNGTEPKLTGIAKSIFTLIKPQIIANNARYFNGKQGGRPKKDETENEPSDEPSDRENEPKSNQKETKQKPKQNLDETESEPKNIQSETKAKPNENEKDNVKGNDNVKDNDKVNEKDSVKGKTATATSRSTRTVFVKPTVEEIQAYCSERRNNVDAQRFFDYYESNGWKVGRSPMKDWKAAVRTWERNGFDSPSKSKPSASDDDWLKTLADL